jgi:glyoxylase-like metal-dependent hydrolase (beta-lactamase superfamily II)
LNTAVDDLTKQADAGPLAPVHFPYDEQPGTDTAIEVRPGIFWIATPLPFKLRAINLWALRDGDGWTLVDAGYGWGETQEQLIKVRKECLDGAPIKRLIITHFHPDHIGSSGWVEKTWGIRPHMTQSEWMAACLAIGRTASDDLEARCEFYRRHGLNAKRLDVFRTGHVRYDDGVTLPESYYRIHNGDDIMIDGKAWRVIVGEGHSPEHACLYCAELGVMISGDQVLTRITPNVSTWFYEPEGNQLKGFLDTKARLAKLIAEDTYVLPAHKLPFTGVHKRLEELVHHHHERLGKIYDALEGEVSAGEVCTLLFPMDLDGHQMGFAMGETIAHLNYLIGDGRLRRIINKDGSIRFRRAS